MNAIKNEIQRVFEKTLKEHRFISSKTEGAGKRLKKKFTESDMQTKLNKLLKTTHVTMAAELKCKRGGTLNFKDFEPQQLPSLEKVSKKVFCHKLTDASIGLKPFDCFSMYKEKAYIICMFWKNRQQSIVYALDINIALMIKDFGYKSITEKMFDLYGFRIYL